MSQKTISVNMTATPNMNSVVILLASEDGSTLTAQEILDAVCDYMVLYGDNFDAGYTDEKEDDGLH